MLDAVILTKDPTLGQYIRLTLAKRLHAVACLSPDEPIREATYTIVDLDTAPLPSGVYGTLLACSLTKDKPDSFPYLWLDRPFRPERLLAILGLGEDARDLPLYPLRDRAAVMLNGEEIPLTEREYALFSILWEQEGIVSRETLFREVWGGKGEPSVVNVYIHYLRNKLSRGGRNYILSRRGGYLLLKGEPICQD